MEIKPIDREKLLRQANVRVRSEALSDGSTVFNLHVGDNVFACFSQAHAEEAADAIAVAIKNAEMGDRSANRASSHVVGVRSQNPLRTKALHFLNEARWFITASLGAATLAKDRRMLEHLEHLESDAAYVARQVE